MTAAPLANIVGNPERVVQLVVNCLAVGGAFLLGQALTGVVVWVLDRWLTKGRTPHGAKRAARLIGGVTLALLTALILFGHGEGWTILGGGGANPQNGSPATGGTGPAGSSDAPPATPTTEARPPSTPPTRFTSPVGERVRVTLLGGDDVKNERFYVVGDDPGPKTFAEVQSALTARKESAKGTPVGVEVRLAPNNALPANHPAVLRLTAWAQAHGMPVTLPASD